MADDEENSNMSYPARFLNFTSDESWVEALFADKIREGQYIDYKSQHYDFTKDQSKKELAKDVSAFANAQGGFLVIGIKDDAQGIPLSKTPVELNEEIPKKYKRTIDKLVQPIASTKIYEIPLKSNPGQGFLVIEVQVSRGRPHAFLDGNALSFSIRHGSESPPMSEPELKAQFEGRFTSQFYQLQKLESLEIEAHESIDKNKHWLILSSSPDQGGDFEITSENLGKIQSALIKDYGNEYLTQFKFNGIFVGFRKFVGRGLGGASELSRDIFGNFHQDGSAVIGIQLPNAIAYLTLDDREKQWFPPVVFEQGAVVKASLVLLKIVLEYSKFVETSGQVDFQLNLNIDGGQSYGIAPLSRNSLLPPITGKNKYTHHSGRASSNYEDLFESPIARNSLIRNLCNQLFQNFGIAECLHIDTSGQINPEQWEQGEKSQIQKLKDEEIAIESKRI